MEDNSESILLEGKVPIRLIQEPYCKKCLNEVSEGEDFCSFCLSPDFKDFYFNEIKVLGIYHSFDTFFNRIPVNILSELIIMLKYGRYEQHRRYAGLLLADGLFQIINQYPNLIDNTSYLIAPPKYGNEENQCDYIINPLREKLKENKILVENITEKAVRLRNTENYKKLSREERFEEIEGIHSIDIKDLEGKKVLIIDDVLTTYATVWDLSRSLKEKNAGEINVLVAGRSRTFDEWDVPKDLSFNELLIYFSNLDIIRDPNKINEVVIRNFEFLKDKYISCEFSGTRGKYVLYIDFERKNLEHNCTDFEITRIKNRGFCKHIIKVFLKIKDECGEKYARKLLRFIYRDLDSWEFEFS